MNEKENVVEIVEEKKEKSDKKSIAKLIFAICLLGFVLVWFVSSFCHNINKLNNYDNNYNNSLVNKDIKRRLDNNTEIDIENAFIDYDFFDDYLDGSYGWSFLYGSTIYLQPLFNDLDSSLSNYLSNDFDLGYFYSLGVNHLFGYLTFDLDSNVIYFENADLDNNSYFNNGAFTMLNNIIRTADVNVTFTENEAKFISTYFNLSYSNNFNNSTKLNDILNVDSFYRIDYSFLRNGYGVMHFDSSINVNGLLYDNSTFERIYFDHSSVYVLLNNQRISLLENNVYSIFKLTSVTSANYSNGLISLINRSFKSELSFDIYDYYYDLGFENGFNKGLLEGQKDNINQNAFKILFNAILNAPYNIFSGLLNFEFMGINLFSLFSFIFTTMLVLFIIKLFLK